ncbi:hypothetical protein JCM6882_009640 [Rhodosporidiobolus microsporus]
MLQTLPASSLPPAPPFLPAPHDPLFPTHLFPARALLPSSTSRTAPPPAITPSVSLAKPPSIQSPLPSTAFAFLSLPSPRLRQKRSSTSLLQSDSEDTSARNSGVPRPPASKRRRRDRPLPIPPSPNLRPALSSPTAPSPLALPLASPAATEKMDVDDVFAWPKLEDLGLPQLKPEEEAVLPERERGRLPSGVECGLREEEACIIAGGEFW